MLDINKLDYDYLFYDKINSGVFSLYYCNVELYTIFSKLNMENEYKEIIFQFKGEMDCESDIFEEEEDIINCIDFLKEYLTTSEFINKFNNSIIDLYISYDSDIDELKRYLFMFSKQFLLDIIKEQS